MTGARTARMLVSAACVVVVVAGLRSAAGLWRLTLIAGQVDPAEPAPAVTEKPAGP